MREAVEAGLEVLAVPGPSAMAAALSVSGMDAREFAFYGFLPRERSDLRKKLLAIASGEQTQSEKHDYREIAIFKDGVTL